MIIFIFKNFPNKTFFLEFKGLLTFLRFRFCTELFWSKLLTTEKLDLRLKKKPQTTWVKKFSEDNEIQFLKTGLLHNMNKWH